MNEKHLTSVFKAQVAIETINNKVALLTTVSIEVNIQGWFLKINKRRQALSGRLGAGEAITITLDPAGIALSNNGVTIRLLMADGTKIQEATYAKKDVKEGVAVVF